MGSSRVERLGAAVFLSLVMAFGSGSVALAVEPTPQLAGTASLSAATPATAPGANPAVSAGEYSITGTVSADGGVGVGGIEVMAVHDAGCWGCVEYQSTTNPDGTYEVDVHPGNYGLVYVDPSGYYLNGFIGGSGFTTNPDQAVVEYVDSGNVSDVDVQLGIGQYIEGKISESGGSGVGGIETDIRSVAPGLYQATSTTLSDGTYSVDVPAGSYSLHVIDTNGVYENGYYDSDATGHFAPAVAAASTIVAAGYGATADLTLSSGNYISGTVTGTGGVALAGIAVEAFTFNSDFSYDGHATTNGSGFYSIDVAPGTYSVEFVGGKAYVTGYYTSSGFSDYAPSATPLTVGPDKTDIDIQLPAATYIRGTITGSGGPVAGVNVIALGGMGRGGSDTTAADGTYEVYAPTPYNYRLHIYDDGGDYLDGCYDSTTSDFTIDCDDAGAIAMAGSDVVADITLEAGYQISGKVYGSEGPLEGVDVSASQAEGGYTPDDATTAADGSYDFRVPAGSYTLGFGDSGDSTYLNGFYESGASGNFTTDEEDATAIPVSDQDVSVEDVTMEQLTSPGMPTGVTATRDNASSTVSWSAPSDDGGSAITGYTVTSSPGGKTCGWTSGPLSCTVSGLTNGTPYTFTVKARNGVGTGQASNPSSPVTPATVPDSPTALQAIAGNALVSLSWTAPVHDGGSPITGYTVTETEQGLGVVACSSDGPTSCTVSGLTNGTEYKFTVSATNDVGAGLASGSNAVTPHVSVLTQPTGVSAVAGDSSATVSWSAPSDDGGSTISAYTATSNPDGKTCGWTSGPLSCTVSGLTPGTAYTFTVTAANGSGTGPASEPSDPVTPSGPVPSAPTAVTAIAADGSALVSWAAPISDGGYAITDYVVEDADGAVCHAGTALFCNVTGLANQTSYTFKVYAHTVAGDGAKSDPSGPVTTHAMGTYHPVTPIRLVDSRIAVGLPTKLTAGVPQSFPVTDTMGLPDQITAVTANVTVVLATAAGSVYLGPDAIARPSTATVSFNKNDNTAFGSTIAVGEDGTISATYMAASGTTNLVVDITGYFTPGASGDTYHPVSPVRLLDTRSKNGLSGKFKINTPRTLQVTGRGGIPASAVAVTGNLTVTNATGSWAVYLGPVAMAKPTTSTINFVKGQTRANSLTVPLGTGGKLSATFLGSGKSTIDLVFDVTGYYTADGTGEKYIPITPSALLDTRTGIGLAGKFKANTPRTFAVWDHGDVPEAAIGVTGIVAVVNQSANWAVFVGPNSTAKPTTSVLNFVKGDTCSNGFTVPLSATGALSATYMGPSGATTDMAVVITGYFVGAVP